MYYRRPGEPILPDRLCLTPSRRVYSARYRQVVFEDISADSQVRLQHPKSEARKFDMHLRPSERLEKTLARVAKEQGLAQERLRRWVSFLALCGVLERGVGEGILENYSLKGGVAPRTPVCGRCSGYQRHRHWCSRRTPKRVQMFQDAVALGFDEFTFQVKGTALDMEKVDAVRLEVGSGFVAVPGRPSRLTWVPRAWARWILFSPRSEDLKRWACASSHRFDI